MNIITKSEDEAKGIAVESKHRKKKVSSAILTALSLYWTKVTSLKFKGTLDINSTSKEPRSTRLFTHKGRTIRKLMGGGRAKYKKNNRAREN